MTPRKSSRKFQEFVIDGGENDGQTVTPLSCLRVHLDDNPRRQFIEVFFWEHFHQVRAHQQRRKSKAYGLFKSYLLQRHQPDKRGRPIVSKHIGVIHLCVKALTFSIIGHEAFHAVRYMALRQGLPIPQSLAAYDLTNNHKDDRTNPEEIEARFMGLLVARISAAALDVLDERKKAKACTTKPKRSSSPPSTPPNSALPTPSRPKAKK